MVHYIVKVLCTIHSKYKQYTVEKCLYSILYYALLALAVVKRLAISIYEYERV
jgi:hypothetical protein